MIMFVRLTSKVNQTYTIYEHWAHAHAPARSFIVSQMKGRPFVNNNNNKTEALNYVKPLYDATTMTDTLKPTPDENDEKKYTNQQIWSVIATEKMWRKIKKNIASRQATKRTSKHQKR